jgi:DNA-binding transcriptional LysR family regulator
VRTTRQVTLTADGERLLPYARRVLHRARELAPGHELMARYESGLTGAAGELLAGR